MEIVKTAKAKITSHSDIFNETLHIYRDAVSFIVDVVDKEWLLLCNKSSKEQLTLVEKLIHATKDNPKPKYVEFDVIFIKFPSYFRRSAINEATGAVSSFKTRYIQWETRRDEVLKKRKMFNEKPPTLAKKYYSFPVFYKGNMFQKLDNNSALLKIYHQRDWVWLKIDFKGKFNNINLAEYKELNPTLIRHGKKFYLHIPYKANVKLKDFHYTEQTIIAVDLGLTNSAVCSAMKYDGTVTSRLFINQGVEKDRHSKAVGRLSKVNGMSGTDTPKPNYWRKINNLQKQIVQDTVNKIVDFAVKNNASIIVFEYLGKMTIPKGFWGAKKLRHKLQFWAKCRIQDKVQQKANSLGMRVRHICAKNTSALAFDGSGLVTRNAKKDLCTFTTGKNYHADLNASYNIGARYFIKEIFKSMPEKVWLQVLAKVPELASRIRCTLSSLTSLHKVAIDVQ